MTSRWLEIGDRVFVRRYAFYDQNIVVVRGGEQDAGGGHALHAGPGAGAARGRARGSGSRRFDVVVNSHGHYDHVFGNHEFRPAVIWGHERCATMIELTGELQRRSVAAASAGACGRARRGRARPAGPDVRRIAPSSTSAGGTVELAYLGRGHTDNDIVISVPDADVLCAGDLLENGAAPYFGDGFPMDWPATVEAMLVMTGPRHGGGAGARGPRRDARSWSGRWRSCAR